MNHPDRRTGYVAWQIGQIMAARIERTLRPFQLTLAQNSALMQAILDPGVSSATAARRAAITPQSMGTAVNGLVERGCSSAGPPPATDARSDCTPRRPDSGSRRRPEKRWAPPTPKPFRY